MPRAIAVALVSALAGWGADFGPARTLEALGGGLEENRGQAADGVRFLWRGDSWNVEFTDRGISYGRLGIRVEFAGAGLQSRARGADPLPFAVNIIRAADSAKWLFKIPQYRSAAIEDLYPGIDLTWTPAGETGMRRLNWSAVVKPGAEAGTLRLQVTGFGSAPFAGPSGLWFNGPLPVFIVFDPAAYQMKNGERVNVAVRQQHRAEGAIEFEWGSYDRTLPLYVSGAIGPFPSSGYASYSGTRLSADGAGNWVMMGATPGEASTTPCYAGSSSAAGNCYDVWLARWNAKGEALWLTILGGGAEEQGYYVRFLASGDPVVAGITFSEDFPVTANAAQPRYGGPRYPSSIEEYGGDLFVARLGAETGALVTATYYGGESPESPRALAVDAAGRAYIATGRTVVKWDATANRFVYTASVAAELHALAETAQGEVFYSGVATGGVRLGRLAADGSGETFAATVPIPEAKAGDGVIQASLATDSVGNAWAATWVGDAQATRARTLLTRVDGKSGRVISHGYTAAQRSSWPELRVDAAEHAVLLEGVSGRTIPTTIDAMMTAPCDASYRHSGVALTRLSPEGVTAFASYLPGQTPMLDEKGGVWWPQFNAGGGQTVTPLDMQAGTPARLRCRPSSFAPGQLVAFTGGGFGPADPVAATLDSEGRLPAELGGVRVRFDGTPAPLLSISRGRIVAQAPYGVERGAVRMEVELDGALLDAFDAGVMSSSFRFFAAEAPVWGHALALNEDGTVNSAEHPAAPGMVVSLFGEGAGSLTPAVREGGLHSLTELSTVDQPVRVWLRAPDYTILPLEVTYAGSAPGLLTCVTQINVRLPEELPAEFRRADAGVAVYLGTPPKYFITPDAQVTIAIR